VLQLYDALSSLNKENKDEELLENVYLNQKIDIVLLAFKKI